MSKPITNIAASNRAKLLYLSKQTGRSFQELVQYFALSRFLYRLSVSRVCSLFTLKGAMLLHSLNITNARSTLDIDLLGQMNNSAESVSQAIRDVIEQQVENDGLEFFADTIEVSDITKESGYVGKRVKFAGCLETIRIPMQIDIGFGDKVVPEAKWINTPSLLGYPVGKLRGYAIETSIAEKVHVMFERELLNSRMKDFYDIWILINNAQIDTQSLILAIKGTFEYRNTTLDIKSMIFSDDFIQDPDKQRQWTAFCRKRNVEQVPTEFSIIASDVLSFIRPIIERAAGIDVN